MDNTQRSSCRCSSNASERINNTRINANCTAMKKRFQQLEFAIYEVVLYLDAYPECQRALSFYHQLLEERNQLFEAIEEQCGPITFYGNYSTDSWQWIDGPWPWNYDAN